MRMPANCYERVKILLVRFMREESRKNCRTQNYLQIIDGFLASFVYPPGSDFHR